MDFFKRQWLLDLGIRNTQAFLSGRGEDQAATSIPYTDIVMVERRQLAKGRTAVAGVGGFAGLPLMIFGVAVLGF